MHGVEEGDGVGVTGGEPWFSVVIATELVVALNPVRHLLFRIQVPAPEKGHAQWVCSCYVMPRLGVFPYGREARKAL